MTKIKTTPRGYAIGVACHHNHAGNTGYVLSQRGWWQCQGCGNFLAADTVARLQAGPNGDVDIFRKADAEMRLIASAPDLLAALIECEDLLADLATGGAENPELEMVRAAISRATGGKLAAT